MARKALLFIILFAIAGGAYYFAAEYFGGQDGAPLPPGGTTEPPPDPLEEIIAGLTPEERIGQMVIAGFEGYAVSDSVRVMIEEHHIGGFILFGKNISSAGQLRELLNGLKAANAGSRIPLFLSVDEEGGRVSRMPPELEKLPASKAIGETDNPDFAYAIGSLLAQELKAFGFNLDFAPVLDINSNPRNPVIGDRAYGADAEIVSRLGVRLMQGLRDGGIIPVGKHFPGHGDTAEDSHIGLPVVQSDLVSLQSWELVPFVAAIGNNAEAIMAAHILLPKVDPDFPASLSQRIINGILREDLRFDGVVVTDDLTMGAIAENYAIGEAAIKAVQAGADIVLVCHDDAQIAAAVRALREAAAGGRLSEERIAASVYRILRLKEMYQLRDSPVDAVDTDSLNNAIRDVLDRYAGE